MYKKSKIMCRYKLVMSSGCTSKIPVRKVASDYNLVAESVFLQLYLFPLAIAAIICQSNLNPSGGLKL